MANLFRLTLDELVIRAQSAVRPERGAPPPFSARFNDEESLTELDREEIDSFYRYLSCRTKQKDAPRLTREPFEPISKTVERLCEALGVVDKVPVPVIAMLGRWGIEVRFTSLGELAGALLLPEQGPPGVLINSDQPGDRERFSAAHELGHLVLGHEQRSAFLSHLGRRFDAEEAHADQFASELLVPTRLLESHLEDLRTGEAPLPHKVYRLALTFSVSYQAMTTRLSKLGMLAPSELAALEGAKPGEIAKALGLHKRSGSTRFRPAWLPEIAKDWHINAGPDAVRLLQQEAYADYMTRVEEADRADSAGTVYAAVAVWVAQLCPLVAI
jgi:Zn-dependent peptidase ImmA (M78 family)